MTNDQLNEIAATRIMGWEIIIDPWICTTDKTFEEYSDHWHMYKFKFPGKRGYLKKKNWNPTTDHNHSHLLLKRIGELNLKDEYLDALAEITDLDRFPIFANPEWPRLSTDDTLWGLLTATPKQITEAAIKAMEGEG